ncbi:MAG: YkgJ family cysteine cluster protein [Bacteroidetes bacterium]|nr:YkgJ family cysteine cluster protein [Bacteroidota bacterium]
MEIQPISKNKLKDYRKLFAVLKARKSAKHDTLFEETHNQVFSKVNCLDCANCCKTHSPIIQSTDIKRISKYLGMSEHQFMSDYLLIDDDDDWVFHTQPCPFLGNDNRCSIYNVRPKACSEYPHTNRKKIYQLEQITLKNSEVCPAVSQILDSIIKQIQT